jgi:hypothetical protein
MIFYERRKKEWSERYICIETAEQLQKLVITSVLTGGFFEIENQEEAQLLSKLLPDLEPPFQKEVIDALNTFKTAVEVLSQFSS